MYEVSHDGKFKTIFTGFNVLPRKTSHAAGLTMPAWPRCWRQASPTDSLIETEQVVGVMLVDLYPVSGAEGLANGLHLPK